MAKVKFYKINNTALSSLPIVEGQLVFVQDTGKLYIDKDNTHRVQIDGINYTGSDGITISEKNITNAGVRAVSEGATNGTISVNTNGTSTEISVHGLAAMAYKASVAASDITSGTISVERGGTGASTFSSGQVLVGNGTSAISTKAIDTTSGGTESSSNLISSGAVYSGLAGKLNTTLKGAVNGLAELDADGKVPSAQLPSYVDDVLEYSSQSSFPSTGETGKIYVATDTNKTYRWSGSAYVEISASLALGETSSTAYRGDRGKTAYDHASDSSKLTTATESGLYKVASTNKGHIASLTAVEKSDITALGIPAQDTTYSNATTSAAGLMSASDKTKLDETNVFYGTCTTAADTATKSVTVDSKFQLKAGAIVVVKFTNTNTYSSTTDNPVKLDVNSTGAKNIWYNNTNSGEGNTGTNTTAYGYANRYVTYTYDGTYWVWTSHSVDNNSDTKNTAGTTNTTDKIFLAGGKSQAANPQTYSNENCYASGGKLYSNAKEVVNLSDTQALTNKTYNGYTLADASAKSVDTSISAASTSANLPTSQAVATFVEGKGYTTNTGTITKVQANGTDVASSGTANIPAATTSKYGVTKLSSSTSSTSEALAATPKAVKSAYDLASGKIAASDIVVTPVQQSGATVGTIQVGSGTAVTLYAPQPGAVATELVSANQTYYLTGVVSTAASSGDQIYNTRMSNTFTGIKYQTSTSSAGGSLYVDDREVTLGLHYEIA